VEIAVVIVDALACPVDDADQTWVPTLLA